MANLGKVLKDEIQRLARKQAKQEIVAARRSGAQHRRDIAALKRKITELQRRLSFLEKRERSRMPTQPGPERVERARFSPRWLKSHRAKLGISAADYSKLVGVTPLTIYNWEAGKSKPRAKQLAGLVSARGLGKREALRRLDGMRK